MKQIKYIALLAMALTFFLGQTNVAFSQAPPACHEPKFTGYQNLLTTINNPTVNTTRCPDGSASDCP